MESYSESSPQNSVDTNSWRQYWSNEINSLTGSNAELNNLIEDKEIAARAVAFVVNSTRKGMVPLCADVASLMRAKKSLEKKVLLLRKENRALQESSKCVSQNSQSTSPVPLSLSSMDKDVLRSCSRCSQASSNNSYSPKTDERRPLTQFSSLQNSPVISQNNLLQRRHTSPRSHVSRSRSSGKGDLQIPCCRNSRDCIERSPISLHRFKRNSSLEQGSSSINSNLGSPPFDTNINEDSFDLDYGLPNTTKVKCFDRIFKDCRESVNQMTNNQEAFIEDKKDHQIKSNPEVLIEGKMETESSDILQDENDLSVNSNIAREIIADGKILKETKGNNSGVKFKMKTGKKGSLPEIVDTYMLDNEVVKVRPRPSIITTDCSSLEEQFAQSLKLNSKLSAELEKAQNEIRKLQLCLREVKCKQNMGCTCTKTDCSKQDYPDTPTKPLSEGSEGQGSKDSLQGQRLPGAPALLTSKSPTSCGIPYYKSRTSHIAMALSSCPPPLRGCNCSACQEVSENDLDPEKGLCDPHDAQVFKVSHKLQVQLGDYVMATGDRTGYIRYIGHLDGARQLNALFVGIELDVIGEHDGFYKGKRYFYCQKNSKNGIFVPIQEIICKIGRRLSRKSFTFDGSEKILSLRSCENNNEAERTSLSDMQLCS